MSWLDEIEAECRNIPFSSGWEKQAFIAGAQWMRDYLIQTDTMEYIAVTTLREKLDRALNQCLVYEGKIKTAVDLLKIWNEFDPTITVGGIALQTIIEDISK